MDAPDHELSPAWWHTLFTERYLRLATFVGDRGDALQALLKHSERDAESGRYRPVAVSDLLNGVCPDLWAAIMSAVPRAEQRAIPFLANLPYRLGAHAILRATEGEPASLGAKRRPPKRQRDGKPKDGSGHARDGPGACAVCALASLLAFRVCLLFSHKLENHPGVMWRLVADQAMDFVVAGSGARDAARTDRRLKNLLFNGFLANLEKRDFGVVQVAAKAVAVCLLGLGAAPETSRLCTDYSACMRFSGRIHSLASRRRARNLAPPPGDLWIRMEGPLSHGDVASLLRPDRTALKQYLSRMEGFGTGISASGESTFNWYHIPAAEGDKVSIIRTLRSAEFLAFRRQDTAGRGDGPHRRWTVLPCMRSAAGSYILGLRKDSDLVLRYAAAVMRLKRWRLRSRRPYGKCADLPAYMLVFRHLLAVLEGDEKAVPRQHQDMVLRLSLIAVMMWFSDDDVAVRNTGKDFAPGLSSATTSKYDNRSFGGDEWSLSTGEFDPHGFRVLMGRLLLDSSSSSHHGKEALRFLWDRIASGRTPEPHAFDFLDALEVAFSLGRQQDSVPTRVRENHNFERFEDADVSKNAQKARLSESLGRIRLRNGALGKLRRFLTNEAQGKQLAKKSAHGNLLCRAVVASSNSVGAAPDDGATEELLSENYLVLTLMRQELSYNPSSDACVRLPPSNALLKSFYSLIDDPLAPDSVRSLLLASLSTERVGSSVLPEIPRLCHRASQRRAVKQSAFLRLRENVTPAEFFHQNNGRMRLMFALMMVELAGLQRKSRGRPFPDDFLDAVDRLVVADPGDLARLPLSMVPVTTRDGAVAIYGDMLALSSARYYDDTWGSPALGLHEEMLGMSVEPDGVLHAMMSEAPRLRIPPASPRMQEADTIAREFCERMLAAVD